MIRVGTAGWSYPDWEGRVYPRVKPAGFHPLRFLADYLDCVEVNSTFYAQPRPEHARRWAEIVAPHEGFRLVVKLLSEFTHAPEPDDPAAWERAAATFRDGIAPLVRTWRLAAVLVQFPVSFRFGPRQVRRLGRLRELLDGHALVLEVRHASWFEPPALATIRGLEYSLAHIDLPPAWNHPPPGHESTGPLGYLRLHGRNANQWFRRGASRDDRYDYLYGAAELRELAAEARRIESETDEVFVVANNHFAGQALANALELRAVLCGAPVPAPAEVVASFPQLARCTHAIGQGNLFE